MGLNQRRKTILLITVVLSNFCHVGLCSRYIKSFQDSGLLNKLSSTNPLKLYNATSAAICTSLCSAESACGSFFFNANKALCALYTSRMAASNSIISEVGWRFYYKNLNLCPLLSGYTYDPTLDRCIKPNAKKKSYGAASQDCRLENASLVKVDSYNMWLFVKSLIVNLGVNDFYIQGTKDSSGTWRFDDNTVIPYIQWGTNQPGSLATSIHLDLWTLDESRYHDVTGNNNYGSVCEIDLKL